MTSARAFWPAALVALLAASCSHAPVSLTVSVAASLQDCMPEVARLYQAAHPDVKLAFNYGGSGALVQQIENGAPADALISAAPAPMDRLAAAGLIDAATRRDILRNTLVLVAPAGSQRPAAFQDLVNPDVKLIAVGDPASVPAGQYAHQVLEKLGLLDAVRSKLVLAKDVRQVLSYIETGNADAGIVYSTDARASQKVRVVATAPVGTHQPVIYPAAVIKASAHPAEARDFLAFLTTPQAARVFTDRGFAVYGNTSFP